MATKRIQNVLLATDFTATSTMATLYAAAIAKRFAANLTVAHVIAPDTYQFVAPEGMAQQVDAVERCAREQMAELDKNLAGVPHESVIRNGFASDELQQIIDEHDIDLVVFGWKRHDVVRLLFGSIAETILRHGTCPALIVPWDAAPPRERFSSVLLATDLREGAQGAALMASQLAARNGSLLTLLHVIDHRAHVPDRARVLSGVRHELRALVRENTALKQRPRVHMEWGRPEDRIAEQAQEYHADIVVMGIAQSEHPQWATHFSTLLEKVLTGARCPVLAVPASTKLKTQAAVVAEA